MLKEFYKRLQTRERLVGRNQIKVGVKNSTITTYWYKVNAFFEWLKRESLILENPNRRIQPPVFNYDDKKTLEPTEIRKLYSSITLHSKSSMDIRRDTAMLSILFFCGIRLNEFVSLEVRDIDFGKQWIVIRGQTSKSKKTRVIPMHTTLMFHLKEYISERNKQKYQTQFLIVSTQNDTGLSRDGLKNWVRKLIKNSGVKFHVHQFRHTFACNLARSDVGAVKIQKLLGHSSLEMTLTYLRTISTEEMKNEINRLTI